MIKKTLLPILLLAAPAWAQDPRDEDIFGGGGGQAGPAAAPEAPKAQPQAPGDRPFADTLEIGGRLELRASSSQEESQAFPSSRQDQLKRADLFFDARPRPELRSLLRLRFSEQRGATPAGSGATNGDCQQCVKTELDELWLKWDLEDRVFFTLGKQHLKWGSGRIWNPTDFTATVPRDPFALFDSRLGQDLLKVHIPVEKQGFNYYALLQFDEAGQNDRLGAALRGEFAFGGIGELALSFQTRQDQPINFGLDVSSGLGPVDAYVETALSRRQSRPFYEGGVDPATGALPTQVDREDETFAQVVAGLQYTFKYAADDTLTLGGEYYDNGLGYDDRTLGLYALVLGDAPPLQAGRRYAAAYARLPNPGSWNETAFFLNALRNLSDETTLVRLTVTWQLFKDATLEAFLSQCTGDYGELCFRVPDSFKALANAPTLTPEDRQRVQNLPSRRSRSSAGLAMSLAF